MSAPTNTIVVTEFTLPTSIFANGQVTGNGFQNPENMFLVDGDVASANVNAGSASDITVGGYNFMYQGESIPQGAVITGIELEIIGYGGQQTSPVLTLDISLYDNVNGADDFYPYITGFTGFTPDMASYVLGTSTYLFATNFTVDQINNMKMNLSANGDISLDSFLVRVYFYIPATTSDPIVTSNTCISCDSPVQVQAMYLALPFLAGETKFYLQKGSFVYPNGVPVQPGDVGDCGGILPFVFDEGKNKSLDGNFEENADLDTSIGTWTVLSSGIIEVDLGDVTQRGLDYKTPGTHVASNMSNHDANSKVIISNNTPYNLRLVRRCQADTVFSPPIDVLKEGASVVDPVHTFNFKGSVAVVQNGLDPFQADITIANGGGTLPPGLDSVSSATSGNVQVPDITWSHTCLGVNRLLSLQVSMEFGKTVTGITYNGVPLTFYIADENGDTRMEMWYLVAPAVGTHDIVVTFSADSYVSAGAESFVGVDQTTPVGGGDSATGTSVNPSIVLGTTYDNSLLVDGLSTAQTPILMTPSAGQVENWHHYANTDTRQGSSALTNTGTAPDVVTMDYTITQNTDWTLCIMEIKGITIPTGSGVQSVTGLDTDNTDPLNPIIEISVDGITITGDGTPGNPLVASGGGGSLEVQQNGSTVETGVSVINITGNASVSNPSAGQVDINILGGGVGGDSLLKVGVGAQPNTQWYNFQALFNENDVDGTALWTNTNFLNASLTSADGNGDVALDLAKPLSGQEGIILFNSGKKIILEGDMTFNAAITQKNGWGLVDAGVAQVETVQGTNDTSVCFVASTAGNFFARCGNGVSFTETAIASLLNTTRTLRIEYDPANVTPQARFYVDSLLVATVTTNVPSAVASECSFGMGGNAVGSGVLNVTAPSFAIEKENGVINGGSGLDNVVNADETQTGWVTSQLNFNDGSWGLGGAFNRLANGIKLTNGAGALSQSLTGWDSAPIFQQATFNAANGKLVKFKVLVSAQSPATKFQYIGLGTITALSPIVMSGSNAGFFFSDTQVFAVTNDGATNTHTILSGVTPGLANPHILEIVMNPGVDVKFYVDGVLKATHTASLPSGGYSISASADIGAASQIYAINPVLSQQL